VRGANVRDTLRKAIKYRDCAVIGQALMAMLLADHSLNLIYFENALRELNSGVYLLAAPKYKMMKGQISLDPITKSVKEYWLWICVNGKEEADRTMSVFEIKDYEENLEKLKETGFLFVDN